MTDEPEAEAAAAAPLTEAPLRQSSSREREQALFDRKSLAAAYRRGLAKLFEQGKNSELRADTDDEIPKNDSGRPNIILLVVDTERADATSVYGAKHPTTPELAKLAKQGVTFKNAFSPGTWTVPAMHSMFTGLYPSEHGVVNGTTTQDHDKYSSRAQVLPGAAVTLPERLKELGYKTFGFNTNFHLTEKFGFHQGFDYFIGDDFGDMPLPNMAMESLLSQIRKSQPTFVWLHYYDPHYIFMPNSPWFSQWNDSAYRSYGEVAMALTLELYTRRTKLPQGAPIPADDVMPLFKLARMALQASGSAHKYLTDYFSVDPDSDLARFLWAAYLSEVRRSDEGVKGALETLRPDDDDLIIVTSDHGEEFFEHGRFTHHTGNAFQELLHVPLVIRLPGRKHAGKIIETPVSLLDLIPTIFDLVDEPIPAGLSGVSLLPLIEGEEIEPRPLYAEEHYDTRRENLVLFDYPWKLIFNFSKKTTLLYNLDRDPHEKNDLSLVEKDRAKRMKRQLLKWGNTTRPRWKAGNRPPLSPAEIRKLRAMGYMN